MPRIVSLDLARGFAVLFIVPIHTVLLYSNETVYQPWLSYPLLFIAEVIGPGIFLVPMGIFIALKPDLPFQQVLKRSALLFLAGTVLNCLKFVLPKLIVCLPSALEHELAIDPGWQGYAQLLAIGDILHFAALALPFCYLAMRQYFIKLWIISYLLIFLIAAPWLWDFFNYPFSLFTGHPPQVYFAFADWIAYPLIGLLIGNCYQYKPRLAFAVLPWAGILLTVFGISVQYFFPFTTPYGMYRQYPAGTILHIGIVLLTLFVWQQFYTHIKPNHFFNLLIYSSRHITHIYFISWVLIMTALPVAGYQQTGLAGTLGWILSISTMTYLLTNCFSKQHQ